MNTEQLDAFLRREIGGLAGAMRLEKIAGETLGHPLADVAFNTLAWRTLPSEYGGIRGLDLDALGIPSECEYLAYYYRRAGRMDPSRHAAPFHWAFAFMRWAVIFAGIAARARRGTAASGNAAEVGVIAVALARRGLEAIEAA